MTTAEEDWTGDAQPSNGDSTAETVQLAEPVVPGFASFEDYLQEAFDSMRTGIKAANNLPSGENYNYYSCFPSFNNAKELEMKRLLSIMQSVLGSTGVFGKLANRDIDDKFELLLEANDILLDRANALMDLESGVAKDSKVELVVSEMNQRINGSWNNEAEKPAERTESMPPAVRLLAAKNIQRPQLSFKDKIDNSSKPWYPRIKEKPNSLKPLALYLEEGEHGEAFNHPYEVELDKFVPAADQLRKRDPVRYKPLESTPLVMVEKPADVKTLLEELKNYKEIAVDLEHHSYRTFQGITCLMQISTADKDYLIDTLSLRSELHELNEIFTKPSILKVFHGADLDIQWLQRDLSLYVVNMFDTHQAAKQLNLPYLSLAYLLQRHCNIDANKHYQLADWRIRPLPEELLRYAREDTHYLLHIKDLLRNALIDSAHGQTNVLKAVYDRSTEICKKVYVKPVWSEESYMNMYRKSHKIFNNKQMYALRELHKWRDATARQEDDSTRYVLPNHMLLNIAETLPREMQGILACCNPIPPLVRQNLLKLHKLILKAREEPLIKPVIEEDLRQRLTQRNDMSNSEAWIYSAHDIPSGAEARADLPCLLDTGSTTTTQQCDLSGDARTVGHTVTVFDSPATSEDDEAASNDQTLQPEKRKKSLFVSPFERYKRVIPMIAEQEAHEREKQMIRMEEERLNKLREEEEEIANSKNRVYQHFREATRPTLENSTEPEKDRKPSKVPLSKMQGKKRKKSSNAKDQLEEPPTKNSLQTPVPSISSNIVQETATIPDEPETDQIKPLRQTIKGEKKKKNEKELTKSGMLPARKFDYKSIDFSSFQGGSMDAPNRVNFQETQKKKQKGRKRKKQKLSI